MDRAVYRGLLLFAGTILAVWAGALIFLPFLVPVAWALCLFAVSARAYRFIAARTRRPRLVAIGMVLLTGVLVVGPLLYVGAVFIEQATRVNFQPAIEKLKTEAPEALERIDRILAFIEDPQAAAEAARAREAAENPAEGATPQDGDPPAGGSPPEGGDEPAGADETRAERPARGGAPDIGTVNGFIVRTQKMLPRLAKSVLGLSLEGAIGFLMTPFFFFFGLVLTLVTQYFLYRESPRLRTMFVELSPLGEQDTIEILDTLRGATVSAVVGGILVAVIQGALGTIMFMLAGIQSPVMWGVVMAALSLLPFGGTAFVWLPAGIILLVTGQPVAGWFVLIFGAVIVGGADNILRPLVLSRMGGEEVDIHPLLLFFAILSGIGLFGISGIVFGPLLIALLTTVVRIYRRHGPGKDPEDDPGAGAVAVEGSPS